jgi:hypothetical protein
MQKFTRTLTREIELAGTRLALALSETGVSVRTVGTRRPPWEMSWATFVCHLAGNNPSDGGSPTADGVSAAVEKIKTGEAPSRPAAATMPTGQPAIPPPEAASPGSPVAHPDAPEVD